MPPPVGQNRQKGTTMNEMTYEAVKRNYGVNVTMYKVTVHYDWQDEADDGGIWHCGSWEGAQAFVEEQKQKGADWYSIEEHTFIPCDEDDPAGQLYIGMGLFTFKVKGEDY